jgi:hypothetical protein
VSNRFADFLLGETLNVVLALVPDISFRYHNGGKMQDTRPKAFIIRLRPATRQLLDRAAQDQHRSRNSLVDQALTEMLAVKYSTTEDRLAALLGQK